jgi:hypothetical protein
MDYWHLPPAGKAGIILLDHCRPGVSAQLGAIGHRYVDETFLAFHGDAGRAGYACEALVQRIFFLMYRAGTVRTMPVDRIEHLGLHGVKWLRSINWKTYSPQISSCPGFPPIWHAPDHSAQL